MQKYILLSLWNESICFCHLFHILVTISTKLNRPKYEKKINFKLLWVKYVTFHILIFSNKHFLLKYISISMYLLKEASYTILEYIYLRVVKLFNPGL